MNFVSNCQKCSLTKCTVIFSAPILGCMIILGVSFFYFLFFYLLIFLWVSPDIMIGLRFTSVSQFCFKSVLGFVKIELKHFFLRNKSCYWIKCATLVGRHMSQQLLDGLPLNFVCDPNFSSSVTLRLLFKAFRQLTITFIIV